MWVNGLSGLSGSAGGVGFEVGLSVVILLNT